MLSFLQKFLDDENGTAAVEYVLIYAVVGTGFAAGAYYLGVKIKEAMSAKGDAIEACAGGTSTTC